MRHTRPSPWAAGSSRARATASLGRASWPAAASSRHLARDLPLDEPLGGREGPQHEVHRERELEVLRELEVEARRGGRPAEVLVEHRVLVVDLGEALLARELDHRAPEHEPAADRRVERGEHHLDVPRDRHADRLAQVVDDDRDPLVVVLREQVRERGHERLRRGDRPVPLGHDHVHRPTTALVLRLCGHVGSVDQRA